MENLEFIKELIKRFSVFIVVFSLALILIINHVVKVRGEDKILAAKKCPWEICSIDTMKTSRDLAREKLNNPQYDTKIKEAVDGVRDTGANYITIGTPYDSAFLPYLKRWVDAAREDNLRVWFRGNWSSWEGWFDFPKNMTPDQHIQKTYDFIVTNPDLFRDGDIFDACPECENAQFWPQPEKNPEYNEFLQKQRVSLDKAFQKIGKKVKTNIASIIGGRAKEVLDQQSFDAFDNVVSIDHYFQDPDNITEYINYFYDDHGTRVLLSEFGAPIPDINGPMTEEEQADYVEKVMNNVYKQYGKIAGTNYWVLSNGTTELINPDGTTRKAYDVIKKYYSPGVVTGTVTNSLGERMSGIELVTSDRVKVKTGSNGEYILYVPVRTILLEAGGGKYTKVSKKISIIANEEKLTANFTIAPLKPDLRYKLKSLFKKYF